MKLARIMSFFLCVICCYTPIQTMAETVRVGFISDGNFYYKDDKGNLSGYNYDYLLKVAQYTHWDYEFVFIEEENLDASYLKAMEMIQKGEIDILGAQARTEATEALFQFGERYYGVVRSTLCTLANNNRITKNNYFQQETLRAALVPDAVGSNEYFYDIMEQYQITADVTYVENQEEAVALLTLEEVDVVMSTDFSVLHDSLMILESAYPKPLYFVSTKGREDIMDALDDAIAKIEITNSSVIEQLQLRYFSTGHQGDLIRTNAEDEALDSYDYFTVGLVKEKEPYQFYDPSKAVPSGISTEVLDLLSQIIGVEFRYVWAESSEALLEQINQGKIDIFATLPTDYQLATTFELTLTDPYLSNGAVILQQVSSGGEFSHAYYHFVSDAIPFYSKDELTMVYQVAPRLEEISKTGESILFCDPFVAQYYLQKLNITNIDVRSVSHLASNVSMGVGSHIDPVIVGLLNHGILHLDSYEVDEIIYRNMILNNGITLEAFWYAHSHEILRAVTLFLFCIVLILFYYARKFRNLSQRDSLTKVQNAGFFHQYVEERTKKCQEGCLILIDIDYFKKVNDSYGHQKGDFVIKEVSSILQRNFRTQDVVARLGGDEFAVFLEGECSVPVLNQKCQKIAQELSVNQSGIPTTLSIGGYLFHQLTTYEDLYRLADEVLYKVKDEGRNGYHFANQEVTDS